MSAPRPIGGGDNSDSPEHRNGNGQSILPSSILKDELFNESEPVDRSERQRSRKSVGRRVSFAPTAHVRMFEIPEEKQQAALGQNTFTMPDISSQTGVLGFNLGTISTAEETSMTSNESFDVSVRHSDPSESLQDSEGSFVAGAGVSSGDNGRGYANLLDEDEDDDLDDFDADDDAITMELTGTMDMGAIGVDNRRNDRNTGNNGSNDGGPVLQPNSFGLADSLVRHENENGTPSGDVDAESLLNMLMQSSTGDQHTSLLDNIISQFGQVQQAGTADNTMYSHTDTDITRVGPSFEGVDEEQITMINTGNAVGVDEQSDGDSDVYNSEGGVGNDNDDAVTMELTGIVPSQTGLSETGEAHAFNAQGTVYGSGADIQTQLNLLASGGTPGHFMSAQVDAAALSFSWGDPASGTLADVLDSLLATSHSSTSIAPDVANSSGSIAGPAQSIGTPFARVTSTPIGTGTPIKAATPVSNTTPLRAHAPAPHTAFTPVTTSAGDTRVQDSTLSKAATPATSTTPLQSYSPVAHTAFTPVTTSAGGTGARSRAPSKAATPVKGMAPLNGNTPVARAAFTPVTTPARGAQANSSTPESLSALMAQSPIQNPPKAQKTNAGDSPALRLAKSIAKRSPLPAKPVVFELEPLPPMPNPVHPPATDTTVGSLSLGEQAKAGLAIGLFESYRHQQLTPKTLSKDSQQSSFLVKFKPLFRSATLTARLEYCKSLASLFEVDRDVSQAADAEIVSFDSPVSRLKEHNNVLQQRKDELILRISKAKQKLEQAAPDKETGNVANEIQQLKAKQLKLRQERESANADAELLSAEIQSLQSTSTSLDRQMSEKQSAQNLLLAINGLEPAEVGQDSCDFVYDRFIKLHVGDTAEFASMHPEIDWSGVIARSVSSVERTTRQYTIAVMRANVLLKGLLEDVRRVKRHTFVNVQCNDEFQIHVLFFSKKHRRRFRLQIPLETVECYARLHQETAFDWHTEIAYGAMDADRFKACLRTCRIDPTTPILSIYQHIDASMETF
ncbi:hypothetical protein H4S08_000725 [Coemansia sp. RSA 1365]|nr:hypothetical protein H4S08_000725 [Coemansia sp. RSA 1365]